MKKAFSVLGAATEEKPLSSYEIVSVDGKVQSFPIAPLLVFRKRPAAPKQVLLVCHMDTIYSLSDDFQKVEFVDEEKVIGPGVADAKGGIMVMLKALEAFEKSPQAKDLGWMVILNTDEEISSPSSGAFLTESARNFQVGMVFEPCLPDGKLISGRKGSANFTLTAHGQAAHAGRDFDKGKNAIVAMSAALLRISELSHTKEGLTVNAGVIHGGQGANVVPDFAMSRINIRYQDTEDQKYIQESIEKNLLQVQDKYGVVMTARGGFTAPPKNFDIPTQRLFQQLQRCGQQIGIEVGWTESGGVCDGNRLQAAGLPTVDTLGVQGGYLHSRQECMFVDSLTQRAKLAFLLLADLGKS